MKQSWLSVLVPVGVAAVMTPAILLAASGHDQGFYAIVHHIEVRYHAHASHIPFLGLISGIAGLSTHGAVRNLHLAEFENLTEPVDGSELNDLVEKHVGDGWKRIVRETSHGGNSQSLIYVRAEGDHMGMLVVDLDGKELNVVQVSMNPDQLTREITKHSGHHEAGPDDKGTDSAVQDRGESE